MPFAITMPQLTDTMTEGTVVKWNKKEGDKVRAGEIVAEIETDKATMEMEVAEGGALASIVVAEGQKAPVGATLAMLAQAGETIEAVKKQSAAPAAGPTAPTPAAAPAPALVAAASAPASRGGAPTLAKASHGELHEPGDVGHGATREAPTAVPPIKGSRNGDAHRLFASPLARRIASERGIDLAQIEGTGPNGRVVRSDVLAFKPSARAAEPAASAGAALPSDRPAGDTQVIAMSKMRSAIAGALARSKQTIPHFYETIDIDVEEVFHLRQRLNARLEKEKVRLSIADFVTRAVAAALARHPALNARFNADKGEITRYADVNLGLAVSIPDGLIVPVLRGANHLGLRDIRSRSSDLIERARAQRLRQGEQGSGTFTISSLGTLGVREFSAIINPPEVAILAVGAAERRAVVRGEQVVARMTLTVTLSADHRVVDGAAAAEFLTTLKSLLEEPALMLV